MPNPLEETANVWEGPAGGLDAIVEVPIVDAYPHFIFCLLYNHGVVVRMAKERKERTGAEVLVTGESRS